MTEDNVIASASASTTEERMDSCELEGPMREVASQRRSCGCQQKLSKLEETIGTLQEQVRQLSKICDESRTQNDELKRRNGTMSTE